MFFLQFIQNQTLRTGKGESTMRYVYFEKKNKKNKFLHVLHVHDSKNGGQSKTGPETFSLWQGVEEKISD